MAENEIITQANLLRVQELKHAETAAVRAYQQAREEMIWEVDNRKKVERGILVPRLYTLDQTDFSQLAIKTALGRAGYAELIAALPIYQTRRLCIVRAKKASDLAMFAGQAPRRPIPNHLGNFDVE